MWHVGVMAGLWRRYLVVLEKHPWKTQITSTATLMALGDVIAQTAIEKRSHEFDLKRTSRFLIFGICFVGPALRSWYLILDRIFGPTRRSGIFKLVADQCLFAPVFLTGFLGGMGFLRGEKWLEVKEKIKRDFKPVLMANYTIWPAVQIANFTLVPFQHRVLVVNVVALGWNTYLAWKSEQKDT